MLTCAVVLKSSLFEIVYGQNIRVMFRKYFVRKDGSCLRYIVRSHASILSQLSCAEVKLTLVSYM